MTYKRLSRPERTFSIIQFAAVFGLKGLFQHL